MQISPLRSHPIDENPSTGSPVRSRRDDTGFSDSVIPNEQYGDTTQAAQAGLGKAARCAMVEGQPISISHSEETHVCCPSLFSSHPFL